MSTADEMNTPQAKQAAVPTPRRGRAARVTSAGHVLSPAGEPAQELAPGIVPIPGLKDVWGYRVADRAIVYLRKRQEPPGSEGGAVKIPEQVGTVPPVTGWVLKKTEDGADTVTEYRLQHADGHNEVVSEDQLDRGTWAGPLGMDRPGGKDALLAFATVIRREAREAPEVSAVPYMSEDGDMVLPEADTQNLGYRVTAGGEDEARAAWRVVLQHSTDPARTLLALGAMMSGPLVAALDLPAHIVNLVGPGQRGKSTTQTVQAATFGAVDEKLLRAWNSSAQGITQPLKRARYLPIALEEASSSDGGVAKMETMMSALVAGANRAIGSTDQNGVPSVGRWRSVISSSSNLPLRRPGQSEDLASRLYELEAPFWPHAWVDRDGSLVDGPDVPGALHVSKWVRRTARRFHGWPIEWAYRAGWFTAKGIETLRDLHDRAVSRIAPRDGGIATTIGEVHALWVVGAHLLGIVCGVDGLGDLAEAEAVRLLPDAVESSTAAVLGPDERLWEAITAAMAKGRRTFPAVGNGKDGADSLRAEMDAAGADVHGFLCDTDAWVIPGKLREIATRADLLDVMHAGLTGLRKSRVLVPGDSSRLPAKPPRAFRGMQGLGTRLYRFDRERAAVVFGGDDEQGPDDGGNGGGGGPQADGGPQAPACPGYRSTGEKCTEPLMFDDGTGMHMNCSAAPNTWGPGTIGETAAPAPAVDVRQVDEQDEPRLVDERQADPAPARRPAEPSARTMDRAQRREQETAERLQRLDELQATVDVDDEEQVGKAAAKLRMLAALEGDRDGAGAFAPIRKGRAPYYTATIPAVADAARIVNGWAWERDYEGDAVSLDRSGAWPTAASSVNVVHGSYEHTGAVSDVTGTPRPGYYLVTVYPWTEEGLPSPMEGETVGEQRWITAQRFGLLVELAAAGRWPDASAADSWTGEPARLQQWARLVGDLREHAITRYGRESAAYAIVKVAFGQCMGLMSGSWADGGAVSRKVWKCRTRRPDWVHCIKDQAAVTMWRAAGKALQAAPEAGPVALQNVDELVIPAAALDAVTGGERPVLTVDEQGVKFGTWKVKTAEKWGDE